MRNVEAHLLEDKMDEAVTHYINTHQTNEPTHLDGNCIPMTVQDDGAGRVTIMHQQTYTTQMCRHVSVTEQVGEGPWGEELLEGPIAAIVAHLQSPRHPTPLHKVAQVRSDVDTSVILDGPIRFSGQAMEQQPEPIVVQLPPMQTLPPLQDMKRCAETDWFSDKNKKDEPSMLQGSSSPALELSSPAQHKQQSRKSLPHKKRISRKLKRNNGGSTPQQQELVVINCSSEATPAEQILPDTYVSAPQHHISHEVRPILICQICGEYYGEEQLKFYQHLKQHYEPHGTIIIENPVPDLAMDKMTNNCIVDNVATLPDSIVELSLENTVPKTMYQPIDKHILYTSSDKTLPYNSSKVQYSMASMDKEAGTSEKADLYETLDKLELYNCGKCSKTFRKQKHCEAHMREAHANNTKLEDMGEFSEPEDLMAGIQVCVGETETYEQTLLPHLTVDNGHVHQEHTRQWYTRCGSGNGYCAVCAREGDAQPLKVLKEEVLQRIFDSEVSDNANFADNMMHNHNVGEQDHDHQQSHDHGHGQNHDHSQQHNLDGHDHNDHSHEHNDHSHRHNDHSHGHNDHSHGHNDHSHGHNDHSHGHNDHNHRHNGQDHNDHSHNDHAHEHSNHIHERNEYDHRHNDHSHDHSDHNDHNGHNHRSHELSQGHDEHSQEYNEHSHDHSVRSDHGHGHSDHGPSHNDHSQGRNDYDHAYNDHDHGDNRHDHGHSDNSQEAIIEQPLEIIQKSEHMEQLELRVKQFECQKCDRVFVHRNSLIYHMLSHNGKQHTCRDCNKGFYTAGALKIHKRVHNGDRPYKCDVCGREFRQWSDLQYHKISIHSEKKHFKCEFCNKEFARKYSLNVHVRIHTGEKNYKCDICGKTFRASSYRQMHMRTHTDDRPYKCEQCEKSFRSGFDLRRHVLIHDKYRARLVEYKAQLKETQKKTKMIDTKEEKLETSPKKVKQVALASTAKPTKPTPKKAQKPKKTSKKGSAPNITVQNREGQFKANGYNNVEPYDTRPDLAKFKNYEENDYKTQIVYKEEPIQRDLATLRPMFRGSTLEAEPEKVVYKSENTDGTLHVITVERGKEYTGSIVSNTQVLTDIRQLDREVGKDVRSEMSGEGTESGFLERLTAMYNIPAV